MERIVMAASHRRGLRLLVLWIAVLLVEVGCALAYHVFFPADPAHEYTTPSQGYAVALLVLGVALPIGAAVFSLAPRLRGTSRRHRRSRVRDD
jgi:hypothetical protein